MSLKIPQNWKDDKLFRALVIGAGRGSTDNTKNLRETLNRALRAKRDGDQEAYQRNIDALDKIAQDRPSLLDPAMRQLQYILDQYKGEARTIEEIVTNSAVGGESRFRDVGPGQMRNLLSVLTPFQELGYLDNKGQEDYQKAYTETERQLKQFGGIKDDSELKSTLDDITLSTNINNTGAKTPLFRLQQDIQKKIESEVQSRRQLLDVEANVRRGRELSPGDYAVLQRIGLDPNNPQLVNEIQRVMSDTEGLLEARAASIEEANQSVRDDLENEKVQADRVAQFGIPQQSQTQSSLPFSLVENIASSTGIGNERVQSLKDNMMRFMQDQPGATAEDARQWALVDKGPTHPEFHAINMIARSLGSNTPIEGLQHEVSLRTQNGLATPNFSQEIIANTTPEALQAEQARVQTFVNNQPATSTSAPNVVNQTSAETSTASNSGPTREEKLQKAFAMIDNDPNLSQFAKDLFKKTVRNWTPDKILDTDNILKEFNRITRESIDPFFSEQVNAFTQQVKDQVEQANIDRALELEAQRESAGRAFENQITNLEASGLINTGEAGRTLGQEGVIQTKAIPFGGQVGEGIIPQANRLIATSSMERQRRRLAEIGRQAEQRLGTQGAMDLKIPGFTPTPGGIDVTGSFKQSREGAQADILRQLSNQERANVQFQKPVSF